MEQHDIGSCVICISSKVEYLDKKGVAKILPKKMYCCLN